MTTTKSTVRMKYNRESRTLTIESFGETGSYVSLLITRELTKDLARLLRRERAEKDSP